MLEITSSISIEPTRLSIIKNTGLLHDILTKQFREITLNYPPEIDAVKNLKVILSIQYKRNLELR